MEELAELINAQFEILYEYMEDMSPSHLVQGSRILYCVRE